jgi:hypothetical protein
LTIVKFAGFLNAKRCGSRLRVHAFSVQDPSRVSAIESLGRPLQLLNQLTQ